MAERSYPVSKVGGSSQEELPHVQGKEQQLLFAGAAVKRYPRLWCPLSVPPSYLGFMYLDLHDPDNHDDVITHLEPDILECEVKWALGSIITNKASGGDGMLVELFQILKDDAVKVLHSICQQIWKTQLWPQDWKRSVFFPIPKKERQCWRILKILHNCTHLTR